MICHKDRTYCPYWETCYGGEKCYFAATEEVKKEAEKTGIPIAYYAEIPSCYICKETRTEL